MRDFCARAAAYTVCFIILALGLIWMGVIAFSIVTTILRSF